MARKKRSLKRRPESELLARLFGSVTNLENEDLDTLYNAIAPLESAKSVVNILTSESEARYRGRRQPIPNHVQSIRTCKTLSLTEPAEATSRVQSMASAAAATPFFDQNDNSEPDARNVAELVDELDADSRERESVHPAARLAEKLLDHFGMADKPDVQALCRLLGLRVREKKFHSFAGILIRREHAASGIIGVNAAYDDVYKRFTVAHEIGHFLIPSDQKPETRCKAGLIECFSSKLDSPEIAANEFAAELVLPRKIAEKHFDLNRPSLSQIAQVAREFDTDLVVATQRYLVLTNQPCAMVWSERGRAAWSCATSSLPFELALGYLPATASMAGRLFAGKQVSAGMQEMGSHLWFDTSSAARIGSVFEESVAFPGTHNVLSLVWVPLDHIDPQEQELPHRGQREKTS